MIKSQISQVTVVVIVIFVCFLSCFVLHAHAQYYKDNNPFNFVSDLMDLLLQYQVDIGDDLLFAIQVQSIRAVKRLCHNLSARASDKEKVRIRTLIC